VENIIFSLPSISVVHIVLDLFMAINIMNTTASPIVKRTIDLLWIDRVFNVVNCVDKTVSVSVCVRVHSNENMSSLMERIYIDRIFFCLVYTIWNKNFCIEHFTCSMCEKKFNEKSQLFDVDATPVCKRCYGKLSSNIRRSIEKQAKHRAMSLIEKQTIV
jgi:hypothetical protein